MHRDTMINVIKRKIALTYKSQTAAAEALGLSRQHLNTVLNNDIEIPECLLDWVGYRKHTVTTYVRK